MWFSLSGAQEGHSGAYTVWVSAQKTEAEAQSSYRALQGKYPAVLGGRDASIRRVDLGEGGIFYRAEVGSFATAEQATAFSNNLKAAGGQEGGIFLHWCYAPSGRTAVEKVPAKNLWN
jgi:hypothetical protein